MCIGRCSSLAKPTSAPSHIHISLISWDSEVPLLFQSPEPALMCANGCSGVAHTPDLALVCSSMCCNLTGETPKKPYQVCPRPSSCINLWVLWPGFAQYTSKPGFLRTGRCCSLFEETLRNTHQTHPETQLLCALADAVAWSILAHPKAWILHLRLAGVVACPSLPSNLALG